MDAESIFRISDTGGALGSLVVFAGYLVLQKRALTARNNELADRHHETELKYLDSISSVQRTVERLGDKLSA